MTLIILGINHKKAPIEIREKFNFRDDSHEEHYRALLNHSELEEIFILSTCNRVEIYAVSNNADKGVEQIKEFLCDVHHVSADFLKHYFYQKSGEPALEHFYRVASGLDSMMIGEPQIVGQIKKAYERASTIGAVKTCLHKTIQDALCVGKKVRTQTGISRGVTSIPGVVVDMIKKETKLKDKKILVIGAGKFGALTVAKLADTHPNEITIINRDRSRAEELMKTLNVRVGDFSDMPQEMASADILIAATASPHLISKDVVNQIFFKRQKELLIIDLGVPRNIDESVRTIKKVRLYNIDDLAPVIEKTILDRSFEAEKAEAIIQKEIVLLRRKAFPITEAESLCEVSFLV